MRAAHHTCHLLKWVPAAIKEEAEGSGQLVWEEMLLTIDGFSDGSSSSMVGQRIFVTAAIDGFHSSLIADGLLLLVGHREEDATHTGC
ncbi:hypothetical protein ACLOJK_021995 [Asimina triloba]